MSLTVLLQQAVCGAIAAGGFAVLFNVRRGLLPWCALSGALAMAVRAGLLGCGWKLEAASFVAALGVGAAVQLLRKHVGISLEAFEAVGCIPMIPGAFAAKAILGLFSVTTTYTVEQTEPFLSAMQYALRVIFTTGAIATGVAIPTLLVRSRGR